MDQYLTVSIEVGRRIGCKGVLLGGKDPSGQNPFPGWFSWREFVPLARILPRAAAIVHHGGIGTAASALKHGIPQLIVPRVLLRDARRGGKPSSNSFPVATKRPVLGQLPNDSLAGLASF
jgi:UDP:flavonoid glycosyltransferase YjiC (YdhE family)